MYHDLCIPYNSSAADLQRTLLFLSELSYSVIAISFSPTPGQQPTKQQTIPALPAAPPGLKRILTRFTLPLLGTSELPNTRLQSLQQTYDLVALRPTSEKTLLLATSNPDVDLISLDLSARWFFHFRPKMFSAARKRGVYFELCYSAATQSSASTQGTGAKHANAEKVDMIPATDASAARRNFISNATSLIRALRGGRNVIFSSEARSVLGLRAPMDVVNLGVVLGLSAERGLEAVRDAPALVVRAAQARRQGWRGVLLNVNVVGVEEEQKGHGQENGETAVVSGKAEQGTKRKADDATTTEPPVDTQMHLDKPMSNRQKKKMKQRERMAQGQDNRLMDTTKSALEDKT